MTYVIARSSETVSESREETSTVADDAGKHRLEKWRREAQRLRAARFAADDDGSLVLAKENCEARVDLSETTGLPAGPGSAHLVEQVAGCLTHQLGDPVEAANRAAALMRAVEPQDAVEGMLAAQIVATHHAGMEMLSRALHPDQPPEIANSCAYRAERLLKRSAELIEVLAKYRGRITEQKVTVEHVTVADGGQAIVGAITKSG